eukprot:TRINITY_DN14496_c0_g2_i1.p2 TRINITY_DN14496_c0_g2~~TRINITY_DN14496_c0_g2_i1.p2  ORF type:complete len:381 (+),score=129.14 TRINITY_DN14496_c0_g2_i1:141-1283(+)
MHVNAYSEGSDSERDDRASGISAPHNAVPRFRQLIFLYLGSGSLLLGIILGVIGISMKWIDSNNFPKVIGGYFAILSAVMSVFQIMEHLSAFIDPDVQSRVIRILVMVPLYGLTSFVAMNYQSAATVLDLVRDSYESYALYTFFSLMMGLLGGTDTLLRELMAESGDPFPHPFPFCKMRPYSFSPTTLHRIRLSVVQFMILKPTCALVTIILDSQGKYKNNDQLLDFEYGWVYLTFIYNVSISIALYGLVYFYQSAKELLREHNPFMKFWCIKGVLFLSYWQSLLIAILSATNSLPTFKMWENGDQAAGLQDFLICCEMFVFAMLHKFVFGVQEISDAHRDEDSGLLPIARADMWRNLKLTLKHEDVRNDFKNIWSFGKI